MKLLTRYLSTNIFKGILLGLMLILSIELLFTFINELKHVGSGNYNLIAMLTYISLTLPFKINQFFPMGALLGTLMGLGMMAQKSELLIIRATGWSIFRINLSILGLGLVLSLISWFLGEVVAPYTVNYATYKRSLALSEGQILQTEQGIWLRDANNFIYIRDLTPEGQLEDIIRYQFNDNDELKRISHAKKGNYKKNHWLLEEVKETSFQLTHTESNHLASEKWYSNINQNLIDIAKSKKNEYLSLIEIWKTISFRSANNLNSDALKLIFWNKIIQPISTLTMMFLAIPFVYGPLRQSTMGLKMVTGISLGFSFYLINNLFGPLMLIYSLPPLLGSLLPTSLFLIGGIYLNRKIF